MAPAVLRAGQQEAIGDEQTITRFLTRTTAMSPTERVENLVLGGGASGKLISWDLAGAGQRTAVIERG